MTIEEVKTKRLEMEQRISAAMKEFEDSTGLEVKTIGFSRCVKSNEDGLDIDYSYNIETQVKL